MQRGEQHVLTVSHKDPTALPWVITNERESAETPSSDMVKFRLWLEVKIMWLADLPLGKGSAP